MSETPPPVSNDVDATFGLDEDRRIKMKMGTLKTLIVVVACGVAASVGWAVNLKLSISAQSDRSERIEARITSIESNAREQTNAMFEQKLNLKLMDQKLDNIARGQVR